MTSDCKDTIFANRNSNKNEMKNQLLILLCMLVWTAQAQEIGRYDIVIHEIMADPTPVIGLPAAEYIELHNRLPHSCTLNGWKLKIGNTVKNLPDITLDSAGYCLVIAEKFKTDFLPLCANLATLSSLSITDGGQSLTLYNADGQVIHSVTFRNSWHTESIKRDGGWSLEILDEELPCTGRENWKSSVSPSGGSPGAPNAAHQDIGDYEPPGLQRLTLLDSSTIRLFFTEPVQPPSPLPHDWITLEPRMDILDIREVPPNFDALDIQTAEPLRMGVRYTLSMNGPLCDCAGNAIRAESLPVGVSEPPIHGDIVINEILPHPFEGADADFVEIYNRSDKVIDLKEVKIGSGGDTLPNKAAIAVSSGRQLFPGEYCVLCKDRAHTSEHYFCRDPQALQACDSLPAYANAEGVVFLTDIGLQVLDRFAYNEKMHHAGLISDEGVSLERLRTDAPTQDDDNWHSAASTAGFGTPGYENSQRGIELPRDDISVTPPVFSPDNDGFDDYTEFAFNFTQLENRLSIQIFDRHGHPVRMLVNNELCGAEAVVRWDGTDNNGQLLPSGSYVALVSWWNANGKPKQVRRVVGIWH